MGIKCPEIKQFLSIILIFLAIGTYGQRQKKLGQVRHRDTIPEGKAIIYGNFIQRLEFSSGGFPQYIRLINVDTKEVSVFRVKKTFKSARENTFIRSIKPGNYAILTYQWTQSKWYGSITYLEPIFKGINSTDNLERKIKSGQIRLDQLQPFAFTITENSLNYLGTWNFDSGLVSFTDDKTKLDDRIHKKYKKLDLSVAKVVLPQ